MQALSGVTSLTKRSSKSSGPTHVKTGRSKGTGVFHQYDRSTSHSRHSGQRQLSAPNSRFVPVSGSTPAAGDRLQPLHYGPSLQDIDRPK